MPTTVLTNSERIRRAMKVSGFSQSDLSRKMGVTRSYVNRVVSGHYPNMGMPTVEKIVKAMGLTMTEFYRD